MYFSSLIEQISEIIPIEATNIRDVFDIRDLSLIDGSQKDFQNDVLYIGYYEQIAFGKLPPQAILVHTDKSANLIQKDIDLALVESNKLFGIINTAKTIIDASRGKGLYAELMDCAIQTKSVTAFINMAATKLGNSVVLLDRNFKILAFSNIYPIEDPLWELNIKQGYCNYEFISAVNELESIKNAPKTSEPVVVVCDASPIRKLSSKIIQNGKLIGFVLMLEKENALSPSHFEQLKTVSTAAGDVVSRFAPYLLPDNTQYQRLLYDLLIGTPPEKLAPHIEKLAFSKHLCALCIKQSSYIDQKYLKETVAEKLKSLLPGTHMTFHKNSIAALVAFGDATYFSQEQLASLETFAKADFLRIGISNVFTKIEDFESRYTQACQAVDIDRQLKNGACICRYLDYSFFDLLNSVAGSVELKSFYHPSLDLIKEYDHNNNTDLYHSLDTFLLCGCNIKLAAEKLFIHRNSLSYRLRRIAELTQLNFEDRNTCFLLEMSYRIDRFTNADRQDDTRNKINYSIDI